MEDVKEDCWGAWVSADEHDWHVHEHCCKSEGVITAITESP